MTHSGRCYCDKINYEFDDPIHNQILCYCRECRYLSGGDANASIIITENKFRITKGTLKTHTREDLQNPRIRFFCGDCGTHICVKSPPRPGMLVLKVGTLDDHSWFKPKTAIYCIDKQPYHEIPDGVPSYTRTPPAN